MLIYIHVPFCRSRCKYCAFHSQTLEAGVDPGNSPMLRDYVKTLLAEIDCQGKKYAAEKISSVFFGGGTPSLLPPQALDVIMERLRRNFSLTAKTEVTLEANPESLRGRNALPDILESGVNRLSIGMQNLDDAMLRTLGRPHRVQDGITAIASAREAGFVNVSIDLMWGLPGQSMRQWLQTLKDAVRLGPDHISAYCLNVEPGTAIEKDIEAGRLVLPPERDQSIMFMEGSAFLEAKGYLHYEISNYGRMGYQCRHNLGYWEGAPYLGFGPSATSTIGARRWTNPANARAWADLVKSGGLGAKPEILSPKTRALELVMLRLRTARGLRLKAYKDMTGRDFLRDHQLFAQTMRDNGLARIRNGYLSLTRSGMLVSNSVISNLFERMSEILDDNFQDFRQPELEADSIDPAAPARALFPVAR